MERFQTIQPSHWLAPYVKQYWFISASNLKESIQRVIPSGYTGLVFNREGEVLSVSDNNILPQAYLFGQTMVPVNLSFLGNLNLIMVIFQPAGTKAFFNIPVNELYMQNVPVDILKDKELEELRMQLMYCSNNFSCAYMIEYYLSKRLLNANNDYLNRFNQAILSINQGERDIHKVAGDTCLGYKQFKRLFNSHIGLNPKEYMRIVRYSSVIQQMKLSPAISLSELAFNHGYYDKSHLIKEIKEFCGYTPTEYLKNSEPYSDYKALFQNLFVDVKL